jgi:ribosomal-protein-alanine N-acetyltransferase
MSKSKKESLKIFCDLISEAMSRHRKNYYFAVLLKDKKSYIGHCGINIEKSEKNSGICEIGFILLKKYWGYHYGTEIADALITYSFKNLNMHKIIANCDTRNL